MPESPLPRPGDIVAGKYRIESTIGQGGMGVVLGAIDQSLGRPVAIKFLHPLRAANEAAAARFGREARAAASLQSEHVVRVHEVGTLPNGAPFIVMERLAGSDLAHVVQQRGGLPVDFACDLLLQTCEALAQAHARGIVHRDLKPQNLFLTTRPDGSPCVKVLDFGISKAADADEHAPQLTSTDMVMGTPLYMSPEQVRSLKNVDARADIWALGAILFELLTASLPFDGPSASALHAAIAMDPPASIRQRRPDLPQHVEAAILRCLEKDPARRFQTVQELAAAIAPFATDRGRQSSSALVGTAGSAPRLVSLSPPAQTPRAGAFGDASTMDVRASWQQGTQGGTAAVPLVAPKKSNVGLIVGALLAAFVVLVAGVVVAVVFMRQQVMVTEGPPAITVSAPVSAPVALPIFPVPDAEAPAPVKPNRIAPSGKDAGAPVKPVGTDAGPPDYTAAKAESDRRCGSWKIRMNQAAILTAPAQKPMREQIYDGVRIEACSQDPMTPGCKRAVCREACQLRQAPDTSTCLRDQDALDRTHPAPFF